MKLDLGCGDDYRDGWHNVDRDESIRADEYVDLSQTPWPWADDTFTLIAARHILEHLDPIPWGELLRIAVDGAELHITYPLGHTRFEDHTHRQFWNWHTAAQLAGERTHEHEGQSNLVLQSTRTDLTLAHADPLTRGYVWFRKAWAGRGPWCEEIPGVYGEQIAIYEVTK